LARSEEDRVIPGAGSERGQRPTGCSAVASRAPGRGTEPAPVTLADPYGLPSPDDNGEPPPVSPPGEPDLPDGPTANRVHTPDPGHEHPGAAGALAGSLLNLEKSEMAQGLEAAPSGTLDPTFEAEAAVPATAASPPDSGIASAATRRARPASASDLHPSHFWRVLVDDDILWMLNPRRRVTIVQVADGAL